MLNGKAKPGNDVRKTEGKLFECYQKTSKSKDVSELGLPELKKLLSDLKVPSEKLSWQPDGTAQAKSKQKKAGEWTLTT